jgi:hypothetical protein
MSDKKKKKTLNMHTLTEFEKIMKESPEDLIGPTATHYVSGSGVTWYLDPSARKMEMVLRGTNIVTAPEYIDKRGRVMAYFFDGKILLIPKDEIIELGYN